MMLGSCCIQWSDWEEAAAVGFLLAGTQKQQSRQIKGEREREERGKSEGKREEEKEGVRDYHKGRERGCDETGKDNEG